MTGTTLRSALEASRGHAVFSLTHAQVARAALEKVSTDPRSFFRKREGTVPVSCLLGIVDLKDGIGTIWPLKLRTPDATVVGYGRVDFSRERLDLTVQSVAASTSFFAMDIPSALTAISGICRPRPQTALPLRRRASTRSMACRRAWPAAEHARDGPAERLLTLSSASGTPRRWLRKMLGGMQLSLGHRRANPWAAPMITRDHASELSDLFI
jgi:hypothetical protein